MVYVLFALLGLLAGVVVNILADDLPHRRWPRLPHCPNCQGRLPARHWLGVARLIGAQVSCDLCEHKLSRRHGLVELAGIGLLAAIPLVYDGGIDRAFFGLMAAFLLLIIVIDVEHRLILHVTSITATVFGLGASFFMAHTTFAQSLFGAVICFLGFWLFYWLGGKLFGEGALGFGDVMLAMALGALLGFPMAIFALIIGIMLAGLWVIGGLISGSLKRRSFFAYGPFLAAGGLIMIYWGSQILERYVG